MTPPAFACGDHSTCKSEALARAEMLCAEKGLNLTPVRRRALEILLIEHRAVGAYDLLAELSKEGLGHQPPVAYRALDFLVKAGLAHKIEALNAYVACSHGGDAHAPAFLICRACKSVAEAEASGPGGQLGAEARAAGFQIERTVVEIEGLCPACQSAA